MKRSVVSYVQLIDVIGKPRASGDILLVPALLDVEALADALEFRLQDHLGRQELSFGSCPLPEGWHGLWVRARIPRLFHFSPLLCANNWQPLVNVAFLAVGRFEPGKYLTAYPFVCTEGFDPRDSLQEEPLVGLSFSKHGPDGEIKARIAQSFWSLLLEQPQDLEPFFDYYYYECGGYHAVGFENGTFFFERTSEDESEHEISSHFAFFPGEMLRCPDCDGTGVEDLFPFTDDCATCSGTGIVTW